ncbi:hypothetical protein ACFWIR_39530, partial [Streptomyces olivaceus]
ISPRILYRAPPGAAAVFDHIGGPAIEDSWQLLRRGGTLVSYGTAASKDEEGNSQAPVLKLFARLGAWNAMPNGKGAHFYNLWAGKRPGPNTGARGPNEHGLPQARPGGPARAPPPHARPHPPPP